MTETVIDLIMKATYSKNKKLQQSSYDSNILMHPFNSKILLNSSEDDPPRDLFERVLKAEKCKESANYRKSTLDEIPIDKTSSYYPFPSEVNSKLKEMFLKPRLAVEAKPRGSIDRKLSCCSVSSSKRVVGSKATRSKSRKLSNVDSERLAAAYRKEKRVSIDREEPSVSDSDRRRSSTKSVSKRSESLVFLKERAVPKINSDDKTTSEALKNAKSTHRTADHQVKTDFFLSPPHYNAFDQGDELSKDVDDRQKRDSSDKVFTWSKKETARRKVATWLRTSCT